MPWRSAWLRPSARRCMAGSGVRQQRLPSTMPSAISRILYAAGVPVIGICAAGILVRAIAPLLGDKYGEPPVIAVAEDASAVVPLTGGHRGANRLAAALGDILGIAPAITTAGDVSLGVALDAPPPGWRPGQSARCRRRHRRAVGRAAMPPERGGAVPGPAGGPAPCRGRRRPARQGTPAGAGRARVPGAELSRHRSGPWRRLCQGVPARRSARAGRTGAGRRRGRASSTGRHRLGRSQSRRGGSAGPGPSLGPAAACLRRPAAGG